MASITLDKLKADIEAKYAPFVVEGVPGGDVRLLPAMRLPESQRAELVKQTGRIQSLQDEDDQDINAIVQTLADALRAVAETAEAGQRLLDALEGDLAMLQHVFTAYSEATKPGEASHSDA